MSTREEIAATLQGIFTKVLDADVTITNELSAADVPAWDSLNHIRLMVAVQKAFAVKFTAADVGHLKTVGELIGLIELAERKRDRGAGSAGSGTNPGRA